MKAADHVCDVVQARYPLAVRIADPSWASGVNVMRLASPAVDSPEIRNIVGAYTVTPAIPTHSWMIWSHTTSCTRRAMCRLSSPSPRSMWMYVWFDASVSNATDAMTSSYSAWARPSSSPRKRPKMYLASSLRPTLASHLGDSGKNQTMLMRKINGRIWNAIGKRQAREELPS
jgi:hypothetical protein